MKKFLACLLLLVIVAAGIFADAGYKVTDPATATSPNGTAQINIITTIGHEWPKFQLATKSGVVSNVVNNVNSTAGDYTEGTLTDANNAALTEADTGSVTVGFAINQISDSRTISNYTLTVAATNLVLVKAAGAADKTAWETAVATTDNTAKFDVVAAAPTVTADGTIANVAPTASGAVLTTHYNGKKVKAGASDVLELGTFDVSWTKNSNAQAGDYEAHITLTVASV